MVASEQVICLGLRDVMMTLVQCLLCVYVCHNYWKQGQFQRSSKEKVLLEVILFLILCVPVQPYLIFVTGTSGDACVKKIAQCKFLQI